MEFSKGMLIASLLIFVYCLLIQWKKKKSSIKAKQPPQPSNSWPIIGHLHLLKGLPHISLGKLADEYGPIFMIKVGVHRAIVVSSPEMAKQCLGGTNDRVFLNRLRHTLFIEHMTYNSAMFAFSPYGQYWRELRKIATIEILSNHRLDMLKNVRISEIRSSISAVVGLKSVVDMKQWFSDISINTVVKLVAGKSLKEFYQGEEYKQRAKIIADFFEMAGVFIPADALPFLRWFDIGGYKKRIKRCIYSLLVDECRLLQRQFEQIKILKMKRKNNNIADWMARHQRKNLISSSCIFPQPPSGSQTWLDEHKNRSRGSKDKQDFMDVLLGIYESGQELPPEFEPDIIIKATCMNIILAAADTTAVTLTWTVSLLLNNKDVLKKAQAEVDAIVGKERLVDESDLKNLVYLQSVLKETMRLYPAAPLSVPRESTADCIVSGYHIPAGTQLFVNLYKIHRDPQVWDHPSKFNPERFLTSRDRDNDFRGQNNYNEYMPFGTGRRICPGISYAQMVMQFTLANLLHGFEIAVPSGESVDMSEGFGLTSHKVTPLEVILTPRLPYHLYNK